MMQLSAKSAWHPGVHQCKFASWHSGISKERADNGFPQSRRRYVRAYILPFEKSAPAHHIGPEEVRRTHMLAHNAFVDRGLRSSRKRNRILPVTQAHVASTVTAGDASYAPVDP
jgi:hypothetical protein